MRANKSITLKELQYELGITYLWLRIVYFGERLGHARDKRVLTYIAGANAQNDHAYGPAHLSYHIQESRAKHGTSQMLQLRCTSDIVPRDSWLSPC